MSAKLVARRLAVALLLGVAAVRSAVAQPADSQEPAVVGQRIRVTVLPTRERFVATLVATGEDHMTLRPESASEGMDVAWNDVARLQLSQGKRRNTLKGVLAGAAAWAATVGLMAAFDTLDESGLGEPLVIGGYLATGAVVGSLIPTERWRDAPLPTGRAAGGDSRGLRFRVAVRF